jgi:uncharacterized protein (TIGR02646 family)
MHKLDRTAIASPPCLTNYNHGTHNWGHVTPSHKDEIRTHLEQLQGRRCAYCEASLDSFGQHIEHFRRKRCFPTQTFSWSNLFWSCDCSDHCGHFKDHGAETYDANDLIDPTLHDPEHFFWFFSDGSIRLRQGLSLADQHRANETLRVFNLDYEHGPLRHMRKAHCIGYVSIGIEIADLARDAAPDEWLPFLDEELANTRHLPFATAIKHTLTPA